jgi:hypothetical protein
MDTLAGLFKGSPDAPEVAAAKGALKTAKETADTTKSLDNDLAVIDAECAVKKAERKAAEPVAQPGGRRRKGGKHTKRHRGGRKGKSRKARK